MSKARDLANAGTALGAVTATELGYVDGVTSAIQTQLDAKTAKSTLTTTGDIYYASGANTPARLGIGSTGNVLTVASGIPSWAAPAGGGKVLQVVNATTSTYTNVTSSTYTDTTLTASITPSSASSKILVIFTQQFNWNRDNKEMGCGIRLVRGSTVIYDIGGANMATSYFYQSAYSASNMNMAGIASGVYLDSPATTSSTTYKTQGQTRETTNNGAVSFNTPISSIVLMEIGA